MVKRSAEEAGLSDPDQRIEKHDNVYATGIELYRNFPVDKTFVENHHEIINATPVDPLADVYTFRHSATPSGLILINKVRISADCQLMNHVTNNAVAAAADSRCLLKSPCFLRTMWKTKEIKINHNLINLSSNYEGLHAYLEWLMTETPNTYNDGQQINLAYRDTAGAFNYADHGDRVLSHNLADALGNYGAERRHYFATRPRASFYAEDILACPVFNDNGRDRYLPTSFDIEIQLTRAANNLILAAADGGGPGAATAATWRLHLSNLRLTFPIFKPNEQMRTAINKTMVDKAEECKYYTSEYRSVVQTISAGIRNYQATDIFNGKTPSRLFILLIDQRDFEGDFARSPNNFIWGNLNFVSVKENGNVVYPELKNSKQAYNLLRDNLGKQFGEMPFPYEDYENGYSVIMFDLTPNRNSHLKTLPLNTTGNVSVDLRFSQDVANNLRVVFIGDFRNQIHISYQQEPRRLYTF